MGEEEIKPNSIDIFPDLLEEILLRLPTESIIKCRTVSKDWRSILESRRFMERRMSRHRKILAAYNCDCGGRRMLLPESRFQGDEEIVYLHCDASRPLMTCEGFLCFPEQDWIIVLNPSTRQLWRFPSGLNPVPKFRFWIEVWKTFSPLKWAMGFGRDKVNGTYKVVRMSFSFWEIGQQYPVVECGVLDVHIGKWRKLSPPPYKLNLGGRSACVNGSIYWLRIERLHIERGFKILALDLHKEEFHDISVPAMWLTRLTHLVNLDGRLAIAKTTVEPEWMLEIWSMDTEDKRWSKTYSINLAHRVVSPGRWKRWFTPVAVSKQGNLVFKDNQKRLFKYYPGSDEIRCLSLDTCVISPYLENLVRFPLKPTHPHPHPHPVNSDCKKRSLRCRLMDSGSWIYKVMKRNGFRILDILFTSLVVVGYILIPL